MTKEKYDADSFNGLLTDGESVSLSVDSTRAADVVLLIDGGDSATEPETYDLQQELFSSELGAYQFYDSITSTTSRSFVDPALGRKVRATVTNTSGNQAKYRISITSFS